MQGNDLPFRMVTDAFYRSAGVWCWGFVLLCLALPVVRMLTLRGRHLDALLAVIFLLALNRQSFLFQVPLILSHASADALALALGALCIWYQRHDA